MKKINSIKQLQTEKDRMIQRREELAEQIHSNWNEMKMNLEPGRIIKDSVVDAILNRKEKDLNRELVLKSAFTYGAILLANRFAKKTMQKASQFFKR
jgi:hypothetical protein